MADTKMHRNTGAENFSDSYQTARERFLIACDRIGLRVESYWSRLHRTNGDGLLCDTVRLGSPEAKRVAVLCSSAAGPAGLLGCGGALGVVAGGGLRDLPKEVALVLVHAVNPNGPVWPYFADNDVPANDGPAPNWADGVLAEAEKRFAAFQQEQGFDWTKMAGQTLASMTPPAWNSDVLKEIVGDWLSDAENVCLIDPRTGPGQFGAHEIIACDPVGSAARDRAERWYTMDVGSESRADGPGSTPCAGGLGGLLASAKTTNIILEIGTYSMAGVLSGGSRRDALRSFPASPEWREAAWEAIRKTLRLAYYGLMRED